MKNLKHQTNKTIILSIFLFLSFLSLAQRDTLINKGIYQVLYSQKYKNPLKVTYEVNNPKSNCSREGMQFYSEKGITTASTKDFQSNEYDKGHCAPAQDFTTSCDSLHKTFSYLNCAVQHYKLNRGVWKILEFKEREWSKFELLQITVEVVFDNHPKLTNGGASIPIQFIKTIRFMKSNKVLTYKFPNNLCTSNIEDYLQK